jgi:hypothetical protein
VTRREQFEGASAIVSGGAGGFSKQRNRLWHNRIVVNALRSDRHIEDQDATVTAHP